MIKWYNKKIRFTIHGSERLKQRLGIDAAEALRDTKAVHLQGRLFWLSVAGETCLAIADDTPTTLKIVTVINENDYGFLDLNV